MAESSVARPSIRSRRSSLVPLEDQTLNIDDVVQLGDSEQFVGQVRFIGKTQFADGDWVGVHCQKPIGKNDGSVKGVRYFECPPKHGLFAKANTLVKVQAPPSFTLTSTSSADTTPASSQSSSIVAAQSSLPTQGKDVSELRQKLAQAVEDHDLDALRELLPKASMSGIRSEDLSNAWKIWDFDYEQLRKNKEEFDWQADTMRDIIASLAEEEFSSRGGAAGLSQMGGDDMSLPQFLKFAMEMLRSELVGQRRMADSAIQAVTRELREEQERVKELRAELENARGIASSSTGPQSACHKHIASEDLVSVIRETLASTVQPLLSKLEFLSNKSAGQKAMLAEEEPSDSASDSDTEEKHGSGDGQKQAAAPQTVTLHPSGSIQGGEEKLERRMSHRIPKLTEVQWTWKVPVPERYKQRPTKVADTHRRAITLEQVNELTDLVDDVLQGVVAQDPRNYQRITFENVNLYHMNELFVLRLTEADVCSFVELICEGPQDPTWFISHWWGTPWRDSVSILNFHAKMHGLEGHARNWICTFANNQHNLEELNNDDLLQTPFVRAIMAPTCQGTLMLMNETAEPFRRTWCTLENFISNTHAKSKSSRHRLEVGAVIVEGSQKVGDQRVPRCPAVLLDNGEGDLKDEVEFPGAWFPPEVASNGVIADIATASASNPDDKRNILRLIIGEKDPDKMPEPPANHERYDEVNSAIHQVFGPRAFFGAAMEGDVAEMRRLIDEEIVDVEGQDLRNSSGETPLFTAALHGYVDVVRLLLDERADPNVAKRDGTSPICAAASDNQVETVDLLLSARADPNAANEEGITPMLAAIQEDFGTEIIERLLEAHADPDGAGNSKLTPLLAASVRGLEEILDLLLEAKADPDRTTSEGKPPLLACAEYDKLEALDILLESKADANLRDAEGATALLWAARYSNDESVRLLILSQADVNLISGGRTPLDEALEQLAEAENEDYKKHAELSVEAIRAAKGARASELPPSN